LVSSNLLVIFTFSLLVSFLLSELFYRHKYPRVIGQIFAGILLGLPFLRRFLTEEAGRDISFLADLGIIFLLMLAGLEINIEKLKKSEKDALLIAIFSAAIPFTLGFFFAKYVGYSNTVALVLAVSISLTAEGTTLKVLFDLNALNTKIGATILGAGIIDDVFEVIFLSLILIISHKNAEKLALFPIKLILFIVLVYVFFKLVPGIIRVIQRERSRVATFSIILIFGLFVAIISQSLELGPIIGAFIAGVIIQMSNKNRKDEQEIVEELKVMTFAFIIPFFFINIGLHLNIKSLVANLWVAVVVLIIAAAGKILGAMFVTPMTKLSLAQTHLIGWGMNSRGGIELVIAEIARVNGVIPIEIYSAIVITSVTMVLVFPFVLRSVIKKNPHILN